MSDEQRQRSGGGKKMRLCRASHTESIVGGNEKVHSLSRLRLHHLLNELVVPS